MALITRTYTFSDGTTAYGSQVESEIGNIASVLNLVDAGTTGIENLKVTTQCLNAVGSVTVPSYSWTGHATTGMYLIGTTNIGWTLAGVLNLRLNTAVFWPEIDNTLALGGSGRKWTEVFATNGTINTSHSSTKQNISDIDPDKIETPRGVYFERGGRKRIGYLNDFLPKEARPKDSPFENYESSVIGILCAKISRLEKIVLKKGDSNGNRL